MPTLTKDGRSFVVRAAVADELVDLRWRVLRGGMPREAAVFAADHEATTLHFAAIEQGDRTVSCATFHLNQWNEEPAYQLRGMATDPDCRGFGLGRALLLLAEEEVLRTSAIHLLWCNAREPAIGFYQKLGWEVRSDLFEIPTAGPHKKLVRRLV